MSDHYDVIIVGSGAGGGTLAHRLAPSGKRILILERGDWLPREMENWDAKAVFVDNRYVSTDRWFDANGKAFQPQIHYFVGGATKFYGAALYRLRERDFGELKHHGGISPAWPIDYTQLEPYYTQAEELYQVHGARGEDPTEPPASAPYPYPPVSHEPRIQRLFDDLTRVGLHPFHAPCGIMLDEAEPAFSACIRCATCDGFPCLVHAKTDADVIAVRPALEHDNVDAGPQRRRTPARDRRVRSHGHLGRRRRRRRGAALLRRHRRGLRRRGQLGQAAARQRQRPAPPRSGERLGPGRSQLRLPQQPRLPGRVDRAERHPVPEDAGPQRLLLRRRRLRLPDGQPADGRQVVGADVPRGEADRDQAGARPWRSRTSPRTPSTSGCRSRTCLHPDNRVTLDGDGNVVLSYTPNNQEPMEQLYHRVKKHLSHLGMHPHHLIPRDVYMKNDIPVAGCAHQAGTVRFGNDPATSVLDTDCKAHELDNLYVVDTSFFPSIGAVNPALTAMANALRVGDHLLERLG